jgi:3-deoxy-D-manno-octulosonic-acid transferase
VADEIRKSGFAWVRRSEKESGRDKTAEVILLDSIGELRAAYPLAELVFVGGSLVPHGGQSILEPGSASRAIIAGHYTSNFTAVVDEFLINKALVQLPKLKAREIPGSLADEFSKLVNDAGRRQALGEHAGQVMAKNRGAAAKTIEFLRPLLAGEAEP